MKLGLLPAAPLSAAALLVLFSTATASAQEVPAAQDLPPSPGDLTQIRPGPADPSPEESPPAPTIDPARAPRPAPPPVPYTPPPEPEAATLGGSRVSHGGYGAPEVKLTSIAGTAGLLVGGQGGWVINHVFVLGGAGYGLATDVPSPDVLQTPGASRAFLSYGYGGPRLTFIPGARRPVHLVAAVLVGGGHVSSKSEGRSTGGGFFVVEPELGVEVNVARHLRIALGASYRIAGATSIVGLDTGALSGPTGLLAVKIGDF